MSDQEQRQLRAMVLLEVEEAKESLALLRVKVDHWQRQHERVCHLLVRARRDSAHLEDAAAHARAEIEANLPATRQAMDLDAIFALDDEIAAAIARLKSAEASKLSLGFN